MTPRSCLSWKPTGRIFKTIGLRWVPTGKIFAFSTNKVDSEPAHGSIVDIPHIHACKQTLGLSAGTSFNGQKQQRIDINADALYNEKQENLRVWLLKFLISKKPVPEWPRSSMFKRRLIAADQASVFMEMMSVHISSGLVLYQMTLIQNHSELGIHDLTKNVKFKAGSKSCSSSSQDSYITTRVGITIPPSHSNAEDNSDTNVFTMKMEILLEPASNKLLVARFRERLYEVKCYRDPTEEMHEMHKNYINREGDHASKNDDTLMCQRQEANSIKSEGYQNQNSHDSYSHQSYHDPNDPEKSLTELNKDVKMISKISKAVSVA
ncbi:hypothetical protein Tco_1122707 [Tanacetum coccineum]|uniref:Uncharacterized protein n=1 Tax=Tanacetum coccineum TaxID=301880 RepID=A0ABQ5J1B5_9ASTR